jgi:hypothetical protein
MQTKFQTLNNFIAEYEVDLSYFYSVRIDRQKVWLQGFSNKAPMLLGAKFTHPVVQIDGSLSFDFEYNGTEFQIYLT